MLLTPAKESDMYSHLPDEIACYLEEIDLLELTDEEEADLEE